MGGKKKRFDVFMVVRMPADLKAAAQQVAGDKGLDLSMVIRALLARWINQERTAQNGGTSGKPSNNQAPR